MTKKIHCIEVMPVRTGFLIEVSEHRDGHMAGERHAYSNLDDLLAGLRELLREKIDVKDLAAHSGKLGTVDMSGVQVDITHPGLMPHPVSAKTFDRKRGIYDAVTADEPDDGWRVWNGGECPVSADAVVEYRTFSRGQGECRASDATWKHHQSGWDVVAYRVVNPGTPPQPADEWIPWDGEGEPAISKHERIMVRFRDGEEIGPVSPRTYGWRREGTVADIIAYKILGADA